MVKSSEDWGNHDCGVAEIQGDPRLARLREELACRDEIIVALQHVVRDLRHELENLRAGHAFAQLVVALPEPEDVAS